MFAAHTQHINLRIVGKPGFTLNPKPPVLPQLDYSETVDPGGLPLVPETSSSSLLLSA